jgi:hypothetical protein
MIRMTGRGVRLLLTFVALTASLSAAAPAAPASAVLQSGKYAVTVLDGGFVYQFTWTLKVTGGAITGTSVGEGYTDPLSGSVQGTGARIVRSCGPAARAQFKDCDIQTYVLQAGAGGVLTGTATGFGILPGTTITMRAAEQSISGVVTATDCSATGCRKKGLPGVSVGAGSKTDTTDDKGKYSLQLPDGSYSVKATLPGTNFAPDSTDVELRGSNISGIDFETCASSQKSVRQPAVAGRASKGPFCRLFVVDVNPIPTKDAELEKVPIKFGYEGQGWDPKGGPIVVSWADEVAKKWPAAEKFAGKIYATNWPKRGKKICWGVVSAAQAGVTKSITLSRELAGLVVFADNDKVLRSGGIVCRGELFVLENTSGTVIITVDGKTFHLYQAGGAPVDSFSAPRSCWGLVPSSRGHVAVTLLAGGKVQTQKAIGPCP